MFDRHRHEFYCGAGFNLGEIVHEIAHALGLWHAPREWEDPNEPPWIAERRRPDIERQMRERLEGLRQPNCTGW